MRKATAFDEIAGHIEDGDIGYAGDSHLSLKPHPVPSVAHIRATARGDAELCRIKSILSAATKAHVAAPGMQPRRFDVTPDAYWAAISRTVRGFA